MIVSSTVVAIFARKTIHADAMGTVTCTLGIVGLLQTVILDKLTRRLRSRLSVLSVFLSQVSLIVAPT